MTAATTSSVVDINACIRMAGAGAGGSTATAAAAATFSSSSRWCSAAQQRQPGSQGLHDKAVSIAVCCKHWQHRAAAGFECEGERCITLAAIGCMVGEGEEGET